MAKRNPPRRADIRGQDHLLAYITPAEAQMLMDNGGSGEPGPMGIPAFRREDGPDSDNFGSEASSHGSGAGGGNNNPGNDGAGNSASDSGPMSPGRAQAQFGTTALAGLTPQQAQQEVSRDGFSVGNYLASTLTGSGRSLINAGINNITSQFGPISRSAYNRAYDRTITNPGGINTYGYQTAKTLNRIAPSIFSADVKRTVPQLTGTVYGKKNSAGETLLSTGDINNRTPMGMSAADYYSGLSSTDVGRPDLETYEDKYGYATPQERELQRAYDQYMNPYNVNDPNLPGYNRDVTNIGAGEVRPGLQSGIFTDMSGTPTRLGPVATYDRNYSGTDNLAMMAFGTMGHLARALTNKVTGIEGQPLPAAALAPTPEMIAQGQTYGGMARSFGQIPGQIKQGIESLIAPKAQEIVPDDVDQTQFGSPFPEVETSTLTGEQLAGGSWFETDEQKAMRERQRQQFRENQDDSPGDIRSEGFEDIMDLIEQSTASAEVSSPINIAAVEPSISTTTFDELLNRNRRWFEPQFRGQRLGLG